MRDYIADFFDGDPNANGLFRASYRVESERKETVRLAAQKLLHPVVLEELEGLNRGRSTAVDSGLAALRAGRAACVLTGQQIGVLGGPLLTLYKALSAVKLARTLEVESGVRVVPVFWMQTEDHDFDEICEARLSGGADSFRAVRISAREGQQQNSVGRIVLEDSDSAELLDAIRASPLAIPRWVEDFESAIRPGMTLGQSFAAVLHLVCSRFGLLVFDPLAPAIKSTFKEFIVSSFHRSQSIARVLADRAAELRARGYPLQVMLKPDSPLFFIDHDGKRERLIEGADGILRGSMDFALSKEELLQLVDSKPERFTTSALIRPVLQDTIFPTAAYIAGEAEFKYWTQITSLYPFFNCLQPLVVPRGRFVVIEPRQAGLLKKMGVGLEALRMSAEQFIQHRLKGSDHDSEKLFEPLRHAINAEVERLEPLTTGVDENLRQALRQTRESLLHNLGRFTGKYVRAFAQREKELLGQFERVQQVLAPQGREQERTVSFASYVLRYGDYFVDKVLDAIEPLADFGIKPLYLEPNDDAAV